MELRTLDSNFEPVELVDSYVSIVWTERFVKEGDISLVVEPSKANIDLFKPGTRLGLPDSKEVMTIDTQLIENGLLKCTGPSLLHILKHRWIWWYNYNYALEEDQPPIIDYVTDLFNPGQFLGHLVYLWAIEPNPFPAHMKSYELDWAYEKILGLGLDTYGEIHAVQQLTAPIGPLYDAVVNIAQAHTIGVRIYLETAGDPYSILFDSYPGRDHTSGQTEHEVIRFSAETDSLTDLKEIRSNSLEKNVVYVMAGGAVSIHFKGSPPVGLDRRVMVVDVEPETYAFMDTEEKVRIYRSEIAKRVLADRKLTHIVDGQVNPHHSEYAYGLGNQYFLGDLVELESLLGTVTKARVMEYIRTQDKFGEKSYPTVQIES